MDDREMALELIQKVANHLDADFAEIARAVEDQEYEKVQKLAHKLKGSAGNLSAEPMRLACEDEVLWLGRGRIQQAVVGILQAERSAG